MKERLLEQPKQSKKESKKEMGGSSSGDLEEAKNISCSLFQDSGSRRRWSKRNWISYGCGFKKSCVKDVGKHAVGGKCAVAVVCRRELPRGVFFFRVKQGIKVYIE